MLEGSVQPSSDVSDAKGRPAAAWQRRWWDLMDTRIGIIPMPIYVLLLAVVGYFIATKKVPTEISMMIRIATPPTSIARSSPSR